MFVLHALIFTVKLGEIWLEQQGEAVDDNRAADSVGSSNTAQGRTVKIHPGVRTEQWRSGKSKEVGTMSAGHETNIKPTCLEI